MEREITCINCPVGCRMAVMLNESGECLSVKGNQCGRGDRYARQECTHPMRMITAVIPVLNSSVPLAVKTSRPVPKELIMQIMHELSGIQLQAPVKIGQIIIPDILQTGSDIIAARNID